MEQTPIYIIVRDTDIESLQETVNERIDEGYELAGQLLCVPAAGGQPPIFMQPMTLAAAEDEEDEASGDEDADVDEGEDEDVADDVEDVVVYRRKR